MPNLSVFLPLLLLLLVATFAVTSAFVAVQLPQQHQRTTATSTCSTLWSSSAVYPQDEKAQTLLESSDFAIAPNDLIDLAKKVQYETQVGILDGGECLADDITFRAAVVEIEGKELYLQAVKTLNFTSFFDVNATVFGWHVDPVLPNRVYYNSHTTAVHSQKPFFGVQPKGKELVLPPQLYHMDFTPDGKVQEFGFYTVDRNYGNTGGLGGAYAYFYGLGRPLPYPECQPYRKSFRRRIFDGLIRLSQALPKRTKKEE
ncbi:expressed unknown protein [Seminavis robusta]|uniref:Uncharacterized protein n=1 Tax=Seminavis robusta TaxID=568900 RepID=A0A9N8H1Q8_9STRA|nr:expressed unknown protein [Seminavis robusta]|eukprot:Sro46_g027550.1 n/a (258) ;mRNA; r:134079-134852